MPSLNQQGALGHIVRFFAQSKVTSLLVVASLLLGFHALWQLPREEEPQIVVPVFDVFVPFPGASAEEVESRLVKLGERRLWEIPGVEYIYSMSEPNQAVFIVRFKVGEDNERSLINLYAKIQSNLDQLPIGAGQPLVKQRSIDDVPFLALTFSSAHHGPLELRRLAADLRQQIQAIPDVSEVLLIGGRKRQLQVFLDPQKLRQRLLSPVDVTHSIQDVNRRTPAGHLLSRPLLTRVESDAFLVKREDLADMVLGVSQGHPVHLSDVAQVKEGPDELEREVSIRFRDDAATESYPAVTVTVAKRKGANATLLSRLILERVASLRGSLIPEEVTLTVTRDYGRTAEEKSDELLFHMGLAIVGVTLLVALALGVRAALIVAVAIPVTLALTLSMFLGVGYTLNRITLFALIFTIGILVDDPIVVVENVMRLLAQTATTARSLLDTIVAAVLEVISPLFLATLAVIAAILPMASVGGLMGPYMRPIPVGASAAMVFSMLVSLVITPWAARRLIKANRREGELTASGVPDTWMTRLYRAFMNPLIRSSRARKGFLYTLGGLLLLSLLLFPLQWVKVKMLPFDNKDEFQVVLDLPAGTPLEETNKVLAEMAARVLQIPEVNNVVAYEGTAAPYNFNGLVRHYFLRSQPHQGDLQVQLKPRGERRRQSHEIAESLRPDIQSIARKHHAYAQVAEIPPGPPVLSTLVLEIYGPSQVERSKLARSVEEMLRSTQGITDVATYESTDQPLVRYEVDQQKASLNGLTVNDIARSLTEAVEGEIVGLAHMPGEEEPVEIIVRLPEGQRVSADPMTRLELLSRSGQSLSLGDLTKPIAGTVGKTLYHKNLMPVSYVLADVTDEIGSPIYAIGRLQKQFDTLITSSGCSLKTFYTRQPDRAEDYAIKWDGEWQISYEVFRDLGASFLMVLVFIFVLVVGWFQSFKVPFVVMLPIPLSLVGILPAHGLTGIFFSATSMIGMIAGAGIVVRNAIILVDFIELKLGEGQSLEEAVVTSGAVRFRPMLLTAAAVAVGASVLLADPIFQGLALSLIAGEVASTLLSRTAVPVLYYVMMKNSVADKEQGVRLT